MTQITQIYVRFLQIPALEDINYYEYICYHAKYLEEQLSRPIYYFCFIFIFYSTISAHSVLSTEGQLFSGHLVTLRPQNLNHPEVTWRKYKRMTIVDDYSLLRRAISNNGRI